MDDNEGLVTAMLITCPNCQAKYEVPDDVMPYEGRDVQCSGCGNVWYESHPDYPPMEDDAENIADASESKAVQAELSKAIAEPEIEEKTPSAAHADEKVQADAQRADNARGRSTTKRETSETQAVSGLNPDVARVFREELAFEARARAAQGTGVFEAQSELDLTPPSPPKSPRRETPAQAASLPDPAPPRAPRQENAKAPLDTGEARPAEPTQEHQTPEDLAPAQQERPTGLGYRQISIAYEEAPKSRFGFGFSLGLGFVALLCGVYIFQAPLVEYIPGSKDYVSAYTAQVDALRADLSDWVGNLLPLGAQESQI